MKSENGDHTWRKNKWYKFDGDLNMCKAGFHCSKKPYQAFTYVQGEILALVECRSNKLVDNDKECWEEMRVVKRWRWTKNDSLKLAIFSAKQVFISPNPKEAIYLI